LGFPDKDPKTYFSNTTIKYQGNQVGSVALKIPTIKDLSIKK
jgi:hypothetical protein